MSLPEPVRRLGWLHFWNDFTLDFVSPLLPAGVGAAWLGVMEGAADAVGQVLKLFSGRASDRSGRRAPWVRAGYGVNAVARPLIAVGLWLAWPFWVVACRVGDRVGKGLRGSASDALVADWTPDVQRVGAFARMRVMDHLGATLGAGAAALAAFFIPDRIGFCVALLAVPAVLQLWLAAGLQDRPEAAPRGSTSPGWLPRKRRGTLLLLGATSLAKLSPLLLLAAVIAKGWPLWQACAAWALIGLLQALTAGVAGRAGNRWGSRATLTAGWLCVAGGFVAMALLPAAWGAAAAIATASLSGATEGAEKALVAARAEAEERATAFGFFTVVGAGAALAGNAAFGASLKWLPGMSWPLLGFAGLALLCAAAVAIGGRE